MSNVGSIVKFSKDNINTIINEYRCGVPTNKLGPKYGCGPKRISRILKKNGIQVLARPYKFSNYEQAKSLIDDYKNGLTYRELEIRYNIERECVANTLKRFGVIVQLNPRQHKVNDDFFEVIDTEEKAYWLGFLTTDGFVTKNNAKRPLITTVGIHLANKDVDHLYKFRDVISSDYDVRVNHSNNDSVIYQVCSEKMVADLAQYGVVICKTGRCYYPEGLIPQELERHYWRGCIDGDGCLSAIANKDINLFKPTIEFVGDYYLVEGFKEFCNRLLIFPSSSRDYKVKTNFWRCQLFENDALAIMKFLYSDCNYFLNRKMVRYNDLMRGVFVPYRENKTYYQDEICKFNNNKTLTACLTCKEV